MAIIGSELLGLIDKIDETLSEGKPSIEQSHRIARNQILKLRLAATDYIEQQKADQASLASKMKKNQKNFEVATQLLIKLETKESAPSEN